MAKTYRTPTVATLGAADVVTRGLQNGTNPESPIGGKSKTTHAMLDL